MPFLSSARGVYGAQSKGSTKGFIVATGGTVTTSGIYKVHTFNADSNLVVSSAPSGSTIDLLMVAGGGGGGATSGGNCSHGGGGAGGLVYRTSETITAGTYPIVIGTGGAGCIADGVSPKANAVNGNNTTFKGLTALGGGGANCGPYNVRNASDGGSGGGGQHSDSTPRYWFGGAGLQPGSASGGFGSQGGEGPFSGTGNPCWTGGGGGGAGGVGANGTANAGGEGGIGRQYDISGTNVYYAGGGGGGGCGSSCTDKAGGLGGGGTGRGSSGNGGNGTDGLGGGGGATFYTTNGSSAGRGGTGVVIVRYPIST